MVGGKCVIAAGIGVEGCCSTFSIGDKLNVEPPIGLLLVFCSVMMKERQSRRLLLGEKLTRLSNGHMIWCVFQREIRAGCSLEKYISYHGISTTKSSIP